jgi:glycosyltransferase involved in cell wall biosynthesis
MNKLVICIPTYNRPDQIGSIFQMLENQKDRDFSLVILNDGNNTKTKKILESKKSIENFHYLESEKPSGLPLARNKMLDFIKSNKIYDENTYLAFLDDDLIIQNDFTEKINFYSQKYDGFCFRIIQNGKATTFDFSKNLLLQKILSPAIGRIFPFLGMYFGGFYIKTDDIKNADHLNGGCLIYNFSKNKDERFDLDLNEGNFVAEDTCFSYGLKLKNNDLRFIGNYSYIHKPPEIGGCKTSDNKENFFWYWKHKLYIFKKYHPRTIIFPIFFSFIESLILSLLFKKNLLKSYKKALQSYDKDFSNNVGL